MNNGEIMTFEKYFYGDESIQLEELYFYFQMLRQTKDFSDSKHVLTPDDSTKFEMVTMSLHRHNKNITFNGAVTNDAENRWVDGVIKQKNKKYYVLTHVYRLHPDVDESIKEYYVYDTFKRTEDKLYQEAVYDESLEYRQIHGESEVYQIPIEEFDMESFNQFKEMVGKKYNA